ncbi:MAG: glycosyltransferase family 4 protein [Alphaproteobacteria bacterium]|nr:glycosyltransferase family 4 protein [Alphaproteobacteria bacterium]
MHLTLIISSLNAGGAERVLSELANHWVSKGHDVSLITLSTPETKSFYELDLKVNLIQLDQRPSEAGFFTRLINIVRRIFYVRKTILHLNPDVIVSFVDIMNITTLIALIGKKIPIIVSERTHPAYHHLPKLYQKIRRLVYLKAAYVITQTPSAASFFKNFKTIRVIPNAVQTPPTFKSNTDNTPIKNIISVGRLCPFKGFDTLLRAFSQLQISHPSLKLTIYGEGKERHNLEELITQLKLQKNVDLPGTTPHIHKALMTGDLFIFPSHYEGFPNALCEAMAVGLPVIASRCPGNKDIVQDKVNGRLFPVGDSHALKEIILELIKDFDQRSRLGSQAKEIRNLYHPDHILSLWDQLISSAVRP